MLFLDPERIVIMSQAGPGMLALPVVFQQAGWLPTVFLLLTFFCLAAFSSTMFCEALDVLGERAWFLHPSSAVPHVSVLQSSDSINAKYPHLKFAERREFCNVVRFFFGDLWCVCSELYHPRHPTSDCSDLVKGTRSVSWRSPHQCSHSTLQVSSSALRFAGVADRSSPECFDLILLENLCRPWTIF